MKVVVTLLLLSLALNVFLWRRLANAGREAELAQTDLAPAPSVDIQAIPTPSSDSNNADARELARLRNEIGQLRKEATEAAGARAREATHWQARLTAATQDLARAEKQLASVMKITPEQMQEIKEEAESVRCVSNLKQIGLAARIWAKGHGDVFPPDFVSMKNELVRPNLLFCSADKAAVPVTEWSQVDVSSTSYRLMNPNGSPTEINKPLAVCTIHNHTVLSDGSAHRHKP